MSDAPDPHPDPTPGQHEIRWVFHATAMVQDYVQARNALVRSLGMRVLEDTVLPEPEVGRRGGMNWIGDHSIEIGEPAGENSPVQAHIERFGPGLHSIGLQVTDLDATIAHLESVGVTVAAHSQEFEFIFCDPRTTAGILLQFASVEMPFDPRFSNAVPVADEPSTHAVHALAWIEAQSCQPQVDAQRLGEVLGTATWTGPDVFGEGSQIVSLSSCCLLLTPSPQAPRAHLHQLVYLVSGQDDELIELDLDETGQIPIALTDSLLPGDPRI